MTTAYNLPAGWHPDPSGKPTLRWWDGMNWTDQIAPMPPPTYGYGSDAPRTGTNGMAVASLVLGILWLYGIGSLLAVIFGVVAHGQIKESGGRQGGGGMAMAGRILGLVGLILMAFAIASSA